MYKLRNSVFIVVLLIIGISTWSCQKSQADKDRIAIEKYISDHNLPAVEYSTSGLFYVIDKDGGTTHPNAYSDVTVNYKGYLLDGTGFDNADTIKLNLGQTIFGWQLGLPLIGEGGRIKLIIPSSMGYGSRSVGDIPKNSCLVFDIDLILFN